MKIVQPYARMLGEGDTYVTNESGDMWLTFTFDEGVKKLRRIEYYARVSHGSEGMITLTSYDRFLRSILFQHGDMSVIEHEKVTCEFLVDRGITHEIVRHRIGSYTQESTRFVNYKKKGGEAKFVYPIAPIDNNNFDASNDWHASINQAEKSYMSMIDRGVKPQIARSVFPNALASKIIVTYNLRSWRHFFIMRTSAQAHPQMRQVCDPLLKNFQMCIPILFEDITPGEQQSEAMRKLR